MILALAKRGKTVILSSHLLSDVEDVCDRVVIYYGGRIHAMGTLKELLTRPDSVRITTPILPRQTMEKVLALIRQDVAEESIQIDNPKQNLENYFLDVVRRAKDRLAETSGATSGSRVAAYLRGDGDSTPTRDKILDRLTQSAAVKPPPPPEETAPAPQINQAKLESLAKPSAPAPIAPAAPAPSTPPPADLKKANQKLSSLLGPSDKK